jgi:hypothetical protein
VTTVDDLKDFEQIAAFLHEVVVIAKKIQGDVSDMKLVDFVAAIKGREDAAALKAAARSGTSLNKWAESALGKAARKIPARATARSEA